MNDLVTDNSVMDNLEIAASDLETALQMRMIYSDPPRSREAAMSPGDTAPECAHFGAYLDGRFVGVCSVGPEPLPILDHPAAWRMRGLIVLPEFRRSGVGTALIQHRLQHVAKQSNPLAWGFAKRRLARLYSSLGYCPTGYTYVHPVGGPTLLFGNQNTLRYIERATGVTYTDGEPPEFGNLEGDKLEA